MRRVGNTASTARKVQPEFLPVHRHPTFRSNDSTRHGAEVEEQARQFLKTQGHTIKTKGLVVCPAEPWLAASPDGVINKEMLGKKLLTEALATKKSEITPLANGQYILASNGPKGYYMQVQLGMHCTGWPVHSVLVTWNDTKHIEIQVPFDEDFIQRRISRLCALYFAHMLPKIIDCVKGSLQLCNKYLSIKSE